MSYKKSSDFGICFLFGSGKVFLQKRDHVAKYAVYTIAEYACTEKVHS